MADVYNTKITLADQRMNLHRSTPFSVETTAPDSTGAYTCGEQTTVRLERVAVEAASQPSLPEWVTEPTSAILDIESLEAGAEFK